MDVGVLDNPRSGFRPYDRDLSSAEIARRLGVTLMTLNDWRKGSMLRYPLPTRTEEWGRGHRVWIKESDLVRFLDLFRPDLLQVWNEADGLYRRSG